MSATTRTIKPAPDCKVRKPYPPFAPLLEEGEPVVWSSYWERKLIDLDVVEVDAKKGG